MHYIDLTKSVSSYLNNTIDCRRLVKKMNYKENQLTQIFAAVQTIQSSPSHKILPTTQAAVPPPFLLPLKPVSPSLCKSRHGNIRKTSAKDIIQQTAHHQKLTCLLFLVYVKKLIRVSRHRPTLDMRCFLCRCKFCRATDQCFSLFLHNTCGRFFHLFYWFCSKV